LREPSRRSASRSSACSAAVRAAAPSGCSASTRPREWRMSGASTTPASRKSRWTRSRRR
jgi:hypothetical protein